VRRAVASGDSAAVAVVTGRAVATVREATDAGMLVARARRAVPLVNLLLSCEFLPL
jgi:hypothetical protein